jgi:hypothetical protein
MARAARQLILRRQAAGRRDPNTRVLGWLAGGLGWLGQRRT